LLVVAAEVQTVVELEVQVDIEKVQAQLQGVIAYLL
jgi:hypothetical protein